MISSSLQPPACASAMTWMCWQVKARPTPGRNMLTSHCEREEGPALAVPECKSFCHVAVCSAMKYFVLILLMLINKSQHVPRLTEDLHKPFFGG